MGETARPPITRVQALTSDAIYREFDQLLEYAKEQNCDIVNCDSSHLFAVSREVGIRSTQCGVISDVAQAAADEWDSKLSEMLASKDDGADAPLGRVGSLIEFYVEVLMPDLLRK
jgi:hypothetical protein